MTGGFFIPAVGVVFCMLVTSCKTYVTGCPSNQTAYNAAAALTCQNSGMVFHCIKSSDKTLVEICMSTFQWIEKGKCPVLHVHSNQFEAMDCQDMSRCPKENYKSNEVYKYPICLRIGITTTQLSKEYTTEKTEMTTYAFTTTPTTDKPKKEEECCQPVNIALAIIFGIIAPFVTLGALYFVFRRREKRQKGGYSLRNDLENATHSSKTSMELDQHIIDDETKMPLLSSNPDGKNERNDERSDESFKTTNSDSEVEFTEPENEDEKTQIHQHDKELETTLKSEKKIADNPDTECKNSENEEVKDTKLGVSSNYNDVKEEETTLTSARNTGHSDIESKNVEVKDTKLDVFSNYNANVEVKDTKLGVSSNYNDEKEEEITLTTKNAGQSDTECKNSENEEVNDTALDVSPNYNDETGNVTSTEENNYNSTTVETEAIGISSKVEQSNENGKNNQQEAPIDGEEELVPLTTSNKNMKVIDKEAYGGDNEHMNKNGNGKKNQQDASIDDREESLPSITNDKNMKGKEDKNEAETPEIALTAHISSRCPDAESEHLHSKTEHEDKDTDNNLVTSKDIDAEEIPHNETATTHF